MHHQFGKGNVKNLSYFYDIIVTSMSSIVHWDRLIHKGVRSKDMQDMGNVIAIDDQNITTMQGRHEFKLPRTCVDDFNGSEVFLTITEKDAQRYKAL
jgi:hypothetical protein